MDPYLESQGLWEDFHLSFVPYCRDALNDILPDRYEARLGERLHLVEPSEREAKQILPNIAVIAAKRKSSRGSARGTQVGGTLTVEPVTIPLPIMTQVRDVWIEVRLRPKRTPVTLIEVLSPANMTSDGFLEYKRKREKTIGQQVHLVELDLLLGGRRLPMGRPLPRGDGYALISRAERRPDSEVYAWTIRDPLPRIPIPLFPPDADILLDLARVFAIAYRRGRYARSINYAASLALVKNPEDRDWSETIAKVKRAPLSGGRSGSFGTREARGGPWWQNLPGRRATAGHSRRIALHA
jgi:hypothetical protein